jgi:N-acetyl-1-D-myo-inositol-2-amino-2-deoxy-alpha-D-glucopyranoside deacetylase
MTEHSPNYPDLTLLAVLAHPDDETFGMGGTLALYARRGVKVYLICATRGEVGDVEPRLMQKYASVGELRSDELRCAAEKLGLAGVFFLGYRDSGMPGSPDNQHPQALAAAPLEEVTGKIVHFIRQLKPQVVITFDPIGGYRHPDHIAVYQATVRAFKAANNPDFQAADLPPYQPNKLYCHTFSRRFMRLAVRLMPLLGMDAHHFGRNKDIDLASLAVEDFPIHARIDFREVADLKDEATACHASQQGPRMSGGIAGWAFRLLGNRETFMRVYPEPGVRLRERDLFAGLNGSDGRRGA